jgi:hypothetical protein
MTAHLQQALHELADAAPERPHAWARAAVEIAHRRRRHRYAAVGGTAAAAACVAAAGAFGVGSGPSQSTTVTTAPRPAGKPATPPEVPRPTAAPPAVALPTCTGGPHVETGRPGRVAADRTMLLRPSDLAGRWTRRSTGSRGEENTVPGSPQVSTGLTELESSSRAGSYFVHEQAYRYAPGTVQRPFQRGFRDAFCSSADPRLWVNRRDGERAMVVLFFADRRDPFLSGPPWMIMVRSGDRMAWAQVLVDRPISALGGAVPTAAGLEALGRAMQDRLEGQAPTTPVRLIAGGSTTAPR